MIKTNLLPYRAARKKENIRRQISIFVLFFIFVSLALMFYHVHLSGKISTLNKIFTAKDTELKGYQEKVKEVDRIKAQLDTLNKKLGVMAQLNKGRTEPVDLMNALIELTVKGRMWITSINHSASGTSISGIAIDNKTVAVFMSRIEKSAFFSGVVLSDVVLVEQGGLKLKKFNLHCTKKV